MDRFMRGLIAGLLGGIIMNFWNLFSFYILNFTEIRFLDWSSIYITGRLPENTIELIIALISQLLWSGFLGILFSYLIPHVTSRYYLLKGAFYGYITGFLIYAVPVLFQTQVLRRVSYNTAASNIIGGILFGITTAYVLRWFETRVTVDEND